MQVTSRWFNRLSITDLSWTNLGRLLPMPWVSSPELGELATGLDGEGFEAWNTLSLSRTAWNKCSLSQEGWVVHNDGRRFEKREQYSPNSEIKCMSLGLSWSGPVHAGGEMTLKYTRLPPLEVLIPDAGPGCPLAFSPLLPLLHSIILAFLSVTSAQCLQAQIPEDYLLFFFFFSKPT